MSETSEPPRPDTGPIARESDEELIRRYRDTADDRAFDELVHRYERPIYSYLAQYLRNAAMAEEAFQATFMRVHQKSALFQDGNRFRSWLYSIATHKAIDTLRREGRHRAVSLDVEQGADDDAASLRDLLEDQLPGPEEQLETLEASDWMRGAVDELPEHQRVVVMLLFYQGLKYREVGEILELPVGTVKSRMHKALVALSKRWRREHPGNEEG